MTVSSDQYPRTCFVAMPFGVCKVNGKTVDFDGIYRDLFTPAIERVRLDDGTSLVAYRADDPGPSRLFGDILYRDVIGCRIALVDITGGNANVMYELATRHTMRSSGTVLVNQKRRPIPFDVCAISVTEYRPIPPREKAASIDKIATVITKTLHQNPLDSPSYLAAQDYLKSMGPPEKPTKLGKVVVEAENRAFKGDVRGAAELYEIATKLAPDLPAPYRRLAALLNDAGRPVEAIAAHRKAMLFGWPGRQPALERYFSVKIDEGVATLHEKAATLDLSDKISSILDKLDTRTSNDVSVQIDKPNRGRRTRVYVGSPIDLYSTAAVPQMLAEYGKVSELSVRKLPEKGFAIARYTIDKSQYHADQLFADLTSGFHKLGELMPSITFKIGGGGFGGKGGGFGGPSFGP